MKKYMKPTLNVATIQSKTYMSSTSPQLTINKNSNVNAGDVEAKGRDEDYESTTWSDGGLW